MQSPHVGDPVQCLSSLCLLISSIIESVCYLQNKQTKEEFPDNLTLSERC